YAVICAGMLLFTGCTGTNMSDMGTENGAAETEAANYQDSDSAAHSGTSADVEKISEGNSEEASAEISEEASAETSEKTENGAGKKDSEMETFADANEMFNSADLNGAASECSETGLVINTSPFADGTAASREPHFIKVAYTDETVFQKGIVSSDGGSYSLEDCGKSEVKDKDIVLCFGKQQADGTYLADRIITVEFK
ncbi:MAG: hypothetical protein ACLVAW_12315, partial [Eisenbergiella massiliensis]